MRNEPARERAPDLRDAVKSATDAMTWVKDSDRALIALARRIAQEIETAIDRSDELQAAWREAGGDKDIHKRLEKLSAMCEVTKIVGWLGPQLQGVLRDLAGAPAARKALGEEQPMGGRLAQIKRDEAAREDYS